MKIPLMKRIRNWKKNRKGPIGSNNLIKIRREILIKIVSNIKRGRKSEP